ncbi:MAG: hypothetical protein GY694_17105 [Gammaproteobacteria bacterium]|nr:hypothetical protein [Gammaproteobacteria bacterium]
MRQERLKIVGPILLLAFIGGLFLFFKLPAPGASSQINGEVISLRGREGDGVRLFLVVRLSNGKEVMVKVRSSNEYIKGKRVSLLKKRSLFGGNEYYYQGYIK